MTINPGVHAMGKGKKKKDKKKKRKAAEAERAEAVMASRVASAVANAKAALKDKGGGNETAPRRSGATVPAVRTARPASPKKAPATRKPRAPSGSRPPVTALAPSVPAVAAAAAPPAAAATVPAERPAERIPPPGPRADTDGAIVITGISGNLGRLLAERLHKNHRIIGVDRRPFPGKPKDVEHYQVDLRRKRIEQVFRKGGIKAVFHIGIMHNPRIKTREHHHYNIMGTTRVLDYSRRYGVQRVVVLSSANIYGARPENDTFLPEDTPLMGGEIYSEMADLVEVDMLAQSYFWKAPELRVFILRPVHVVGPELKNPASRYLKLQRTPTIFGFDPMVQVIHVRDVVEAFVCCLSAGTKGIFNITGPDQAPLSRMLRYLGRGIVPVPFPLFKTGMRALWQYRLTSFPPPELQYLHYICMADGRRAREELGFTPRFSLERTLDDLR